MQPESLVIIDATDGGFANLDLDPNVTKDANTFKARVLDPLKAKRCTVLLLDHASTSVAMTGGRKRGAMGNTKKLGNVDVSLHIKVEQAGAPNRPGKYIITVDKDRSAQLRSISHRSGESDVLTTMVTRMAENETRLTVTFIQPGEFRPTHLMEKVSEVLEGSFGMPLSKRQVVERVSGKRDTVILAIDMLVAEGFIERREGPRNSQQHVSLKKFREADDAARMVTNSPQNSNRSPPFPDRSRERWTSQWKRPFPPYKGERSHWWSGGGGRTPSESVSVPRGTVRELSEEEEAARRLFEKNLTEAYSEADDSGLFETGTDT